MTTYADMSPHEKQAYTIETRRLATQLIYIKPGSHQRAIACLVLCERYRASLQWPWRMSPEIRRHARANRSK